jgi:two-component system sensor histidine kinase HydH
LRSIQRGSPNLPSAADLESLLESQYDEGLRYLALAEVGGTVLVEAGSPESGDRNLLSQDSLGRETLFELPTRIRMVHSVPGIQRSGGRPGALPPDLVLEFEPLVSRALSQRATRTMAFAVAVAMALMLAGVFFWNLSVRGEKARTRLEHQRRLGMLGEMSAVLAHEIRNPLASLKGHAQLLAERLPPGSRECEKADQVVREATRVETLTTNLLDFAGTGPMELSEVDVVALAREATDAAGPSRFRISADSEPLVWRVDPHRVLQALANLFRNALEASPEGRTVDVNIKGARKALVIEVRDFGPGLAPGMEEEVFEPFVTTRTKGTGLGLAVSRRIVQMHGGTIAGSNHPEGGALFTITLPGE